MKKDMVMIIGCATLLIVGVALLIINRKKWYSSFVPELKVSPTEDLMREHGILNRILLAYEAALARLNQNQQCDTKALAVAAGIVRDFIEDYHEKTEEEYIFPRLEKAGKFVAMIKELRAQHTAGRVLTDEIMRLAPLCAESEENKKKLIVAIQDFVAMYRLHETREDTEIFPAFYALLTLEEYNRLSDMCEKTEHARFGEHGFENILERVKEIEKVFGIEDLRKTGL